MANNDCLSSLNHTNEFPAFQVTLDSLTMSLFINEMKNLHFKNLDAEDRLQYMSEPDHYNNQCYSINIGRYFADKYTYFYPLSDYKNYLPDYYIPNIKFGAIGESVIVNPEELIKLTDFVLIDIEKNLNINKFRYGFYANHNSETTPENQREYRCPESLYSLEGKLIGRIYDFIGNSTIFSGHTNCDKIDCAAIDMYADSTHSYRYVNLQDLNSGDILPIKEGNVYLKKTKIDLERIEFCKLLKMMCSYAIKFKGKVGIELYN